MKLPKNIIDIILSNKTSIGNNEALPPEMEDNFLLSITENYYKELLTHFDTVDINELSKDLSDSIALCKEIESNNKEAIEQLCMKALVELFDVPQDTIIIDCAIVDKVDTKQERLVPESTSDYSFDNIDDIKDITSEIYKRRFLNALIMGASLYLSEEFISNFKDEISKIDDRVPSLYKKIMIINSLLLFHTKQNIRGKQEDGGKVDVFIPNDSQPVRIDSKGIIFPVLLEESIKGILELAIAHGLPKDRSKAQYIISKTDFKLAEIWDQRIGLPLWKSFMKTNEQNECEINFLLMELSKMKPSNFNVAMQEILANTKEGKRLLSGLSMKIAYEKEQDEFDNYMNTQQFKHGYMMTDDEDFSSDELINDDICSSSVLDEEDF